MPKIIEFMKTETISKGRVKTTLQLFLLDVATFQDICASFMRNELNALEVRVAVVVKHPKDKYDKKFAKAEAAKRLKKERHLIDSVHCHNGRISMTTEHHQIVCDDKGLRIYAI